MARPVSLHHIAFKRPSASPRIGRYPSPWRGGWPLRKQGSGGGLAPSRSGFGSPPPVALARSALPARGRDGTPSDSISMTKIAGSKADWRPAELIRRTQLASKNFSACSRSTDTSCEMPRSACVTPKRRSMRAMVMGLWVMVTKRVSVFLRIASSRSQKRSTL